MSPIEHASDDLIKAILHYVKKPPTVSERRDLLVQMVASQPHWLDSRQLIGWMEHIGFWSKGQGQRDLRELVKGGRLERHIEGGGTGALGTGSSVAYRVPVSAPKCTACDGEGVVPALDLPGRTSRLAPCPLCVAVAE